jgi:hypothetical protein
MDLSGTFDTTNALSGIYLWIIFAYLSTTLNCDLQRLLMKNPIFIHIMGWTSFFFLFTLLDANNKTTMSIILIKTVFVYIMFVLMTKSKWYFVVPVLGILLIDQAIKKRVAIYSQNESTSKASVEAMKIQQAYISYWLNIVIIVLIIVGSLHYMYLQHIEYGKDFSFYKFFIGVNRKCKARTPKYVV